jgi:hypothetical protein
MSVRVNLAVVRDPSTTPDTILPNGQRAGTFAHDHLSSNLNKSDNNSKCRVDNDHSRDGNRPCED